MRAARFYSLDQPKRFSARVLAPRQTRKPSNKNPQGGLGRRTAAGSSAYRLPRVHFAKSLPRETERLPRVVWRAIMGMDGRHTDNHDVRGDRAAISGRDGSHGDSLSAPRLRLGFHDRLRHRRLRRPRLLLLLQARCAIRTGNARSGSRCFRSRRGSSSLRCFSGPPSHLPPSQDLAPNPHCESSSLRVRSAGGNAYSAAAAFSQSAPGGGHASQPCLCHRSGNGI